MSVLTKSSRKNRTYTMELQLTSMIDMFTILLVFLLKSYSVDNMNIQSAKDLKLPISSEKRQGQNMLSLIVTQKNVLVDGKKITDLSDGKVSDSDMSHSSGVVKPLYNALKSLRDEQEHNIKQHFKGKIILQADRELEYDTLHKILYTAGEAGYPRFKLLIIQKEE